jgi:hypothetical protein
MKYLTINTFNKVPLTKNNLVLCDIDDTLITNKTIYLKHKLTNSDKPDIKLKLPSYIDKSGFINLLQRLKITESKLYFITSRNEKSCDFTNNQFKLLDIDINNYPVLYCGENHKSNIVKKFIDTNSYDNIIFIDDLTHNLRIMKKEFGDKVKCFLFKKNDCQDK